jgi:choline transporter-like protein 2/4/5
MGMLEKTNVAIKILVVCTGYCLWCLEKCVKYISKNAYIQIALTNDSFLQAAINAFTLILKNAHRFGFANTIGTVYMTFGCFFIAATTSFGTYAFMTNYDGLDVTSPIPTTVVMGIIAVMVGYQFLSIFSFSSDAILQSFLLDEELRRPSNASRPDDMQAFHDSMTAKLSRALCGCR